VIKGIGENHGGIRINAEKDVERPQGLCKLLPGLKQVRFEARGRIPRLQKRQFRCKPGVIILLNHRGFPLSQLKILPVQFQPPLFGRDRVVTCFHGPHNRGFRVGPDYFRPVLLQLCLAQSFSHSRLKRQADTGRSAQIGPRRIRSYSIVQAGKFMHIPQRCGKTDIG